MGDHTYASRLLAATRSGGTCFTQAGSCGFERTSPNTRVCRKFWLSRVPHAPPTTRPHTKTRQLRNIAPRGTHRSPRWRLSRADREQTLAWRTSAKISICVCCKKRLSRAPHPRPSTSLHTQTSKRRNMCPPCMAAIQGNLNDGQRSPARLPYN